MARATSQGLVRAAFGGQGRLHVGWRAKGGGSWRVEAAAGARRPPLGGWSGCRSAEATTCSMACAAGVRRVRRGVAACLLATENTGAGNRRCGRRLLARHGAAGVG